MVHLCTIGQVLDSCENVLFVIKFVCVCHPWPEKFECILQYYGIMSRNVRTQSQLLSVYYKFIPYCVSGIKFFTLWRLR